MSSTVIELSNLITLSMAAQRLGISRPTLYVLIERGKLPVVRICGQPYVLVEDVDRLKAERQS